MMIVSSLFLIVVIIVSKFEGVSMKDRYDSVGANPQFLASFSLAATVGVITQLVVDAFCCLCSCLCTACCQVWSNLETDRRE